MRRLVMVAALLGAAGCKSGKPADSPGSAPAAAAAPAAPSAGAPSPSAAAPVAEAKEVKLTEQLVDRYIGFEKEHLAALDTYTARNLERVKKIDGKDPATAVKTVAEADADTKKLDETVAALRDKYKLSQEEQKEAERLFDDVAMARFMWKQAGGDQMLASIEKQMKDQLDKLPPDQRKATAAEMEKGLADMKKMRDLTEAREKYGSALVDYVVKNGEPVMEQRWALTKKALGKR